jgi:hypothetical protein
MKFKNIPQFTWGGSYAVDVPWTHLENWIADLSKDSPLELDPDFQRAHVWDDPKRAKYVEYCLRGGQASRSLWWNAKNWPMSGKNPVQIVDGKQRLEAVRKFMRNELTVFMQLRRQTEPDKDIKTGWRYSDFEGPLGLNMTLRMHVNNLETRAEVLQWYLDLNEGGVVHTEEELFRVREMLAKENRK